MATTLRECLDSLNDEQRRLLMYAFEHELSQYVLMQDGRYIGVNTRSIPYLFPDFKMCTGVWSVGECRRVQ